MTLAEALLLRADLQNKLVSLRERVVRNASVQEGDTPAEAPDALLREAASVHDELEQLIVRVHTTNAAATLPDGRSLLQAIARRESLKARHAMLLAAIEGTRPEADRYSVREIKQVPTLDAAALQKQSEDLAKTIRELNAAIQQTNWNTDLID